MVMDKKLLSLLLISLFFLGMGVAFLFSMFYTDLLIIKSLFYIVLVIATSIAVYAIRYRKKLAITKEI